ncbi:MAG: hypothetical protein ACRDZW_05210 [Acidimicrobiales bacterium]
MRIAFGPDGPRCRVVGTRHRRPVTWTVPFHRAVALMADGVPGVISGSHGVASPVVGRGAVAAS